MQCPAGNKVLWLPRGLRKGFWSGQAHFFRVIPPKTTCTFFGKLGGSKLGGVWAKLGLITQSGLNFSRLTTSLLGKQQQPVFALAAERYLGLAVSFPSGKECGMSGVSTVTQLKGSEWLLHTCLNVTSLDWEKLEKHYWSLSYLFFFFSCQKCDIQTGLSALCFSEPLCCLSGLTKVWILLTL